MSFDLPNPDPNQVADVQRDLVADDLISDDVHVLTDDELEETSFGVASKYASLFRDIGGTEGDPGPQVLTPEVWQDLQLGDFVYGIVDGERVGGYIVDVLDRNPGYFILSKGEGIDSFAIADWLSLYVDTGQNALFLERGEIPPEVKALVDAVQRDSAHVDYGDFKKSMGSNMDKTKKLQQAIDQSAGTTVAEVIEEVWPLINVETDPITRAVLLNAMYYFLIETQFPAAGSGKDIMEYGSVEILDGLNPDLDIDIAELKVFMVHMHLINMGTISASVLQLVDRQPDNSLKTLILLRAFAAYMDVMKRVDLRHLENPLEEPQKQPELQEPRPSRDPANMA